ncbi:uncharacterized protein LOC144657587 [Oculina patagonica]
MTDYTKLTSEVLRLLCQQSSLSIQGNRQTLIARLQAQQQPAKRTGSRAPAGRPKRKKTSSTRVRTTEVTPDAESIEEPDDQAANPTPDGNTTGEEPRNEAHAQSPITVDQITSIVSAIVESKFATLTNAPGQASASTVDPAVNLGDPNSVQQLLSSTPASNSGDLAAHVDEKTRKAIVKGTTQPQVVTPAEISTGESPASGHLAPTPTAVQSTTATKLTLPPPTPVNALVQLQSQVITSVDDFLSTIKPRTPVNVDLLESYLEGHPDPHFVTSLCLGLREGFRIGYSGPRTHSFYPNLRSANLHPDILEQNLLTEVLNGHTAGPFPVPPFENFRISPLGLVPKKHSDKWRTIFHLSYPKTSSTSINANIPIEDYTLQYITVDNAIHLLLSLGKGAFMSKTDIQSAFRIIPIHPQDWELLGMQWKGLYFFDTVLPFGLRSAPFLFNMLSDALEWIIRHKLNITGVMHILDDFFIALPPPRSQCSTALCNLLTVFTDLDIPLAPGKTFPPLHN